MFRRKIRRKEKQYIQILISTYQKLYLCVCSSDVTKEIRDVYYDTFIEIRGKLIGAVEIFDCVATFVNDVVAIYDRNGGQVMIPK